MSNADVNQGQPCVQLKVLDSTKKLYLANQRAILMGFCAGDSGRISIHYHPSNMSSADLSFRWMLTWQDTFLSFTYDRPPIATNPRCPIPYAADPAAGHSFPECIFALCQGLQEWADSLRHARVLSDHDYLEMTVSYKQRFGGD